MIFKETTIPGAFLIEPERSEDDRGFFARTFDAEAFIRKGLNPHWIQCSLSYNKRKGTLRGMHFQAHPHGEAKLVRCTMGAVFDVIADLRSDSSAYRKWFGVELNAENRRMIYIPEGVAHGFQTLTDDAEVFYQMSVDHRPESSRGVRWDDPALGIQWPEAVHRILSERDRAFPPLERETGP